MNLQTLSGEMAYREFHCVIHVRPETLPPPSRHEVAGLEVAAVRLPVLHGRFGISFEEAAEALQHLPRFFFEPDGSFVWVQENSSNRFQIDGSLYDDGRHLSNVELKGRCNHLMLDDFLRCLDWPKTRIMIQLVQNGLYLEEAEFRRRFLVDEAEMA